VCTSSSTSLISPSAAQVPQNVHLHKNGRGCRRVAAPQNPQGPDPKPSGALGYKGPAEGSKADARAKDAGGGWRGEERFFGRRGDLRMTGRLLPGVGVGADDIDQEGNAVWLCQLNATPEPQAQTQEAE
jgi:hypothetical protein